MGEHSTVIVVHLSITYPQHELAQEGFASSSSIASNLSRLQQLSSRMP
jgi:hypothetical protein